VILACGATGLLGGRVAPRLLERGERLRALVRAGSDAEELERTGAEIVRGDFRDPASLERAVEGVETAESGGTASTPSIATGTCGWSRLRSARKSAASSSSRRRESTAFRARRSGGPSSPSRRDSAGRRSARCSCGRTPFQEIWLSPLVG
jgi:NAD(P)-dependent dehydrogenase (short-subunit alcohol dehydrogenase family)